MKTWSIQVQAQFTVNAKTLEDACDMAVDQAMEMDSTEWATVDLGAEIRSDEELLDRYEAEVDGDTRRITTDPPSRAASLRAEILQRLSAARISIADLADSVLLIVGFLRSPAMTMPQRIQMISDARAFIKRFEVAR
jgi:hypothetical protein